ncbi:MAG: xanthine dehydrogenase family protein molybdopterin-binding subunit, partial [Actinobacteria bacterium]|nr:xanthine dehydrogenase family protein molybdopterin-binding subunit [Actinomycetota bacterium]
MATLVGRALGGRIARNEDERLLRGDGMYVDDVHTPGALHVAFVRSPVAHARIRSIDVSAAAGLPGVVKVYTHSDLGEHDKPLPLLFPHEDMPYPATQHPLAVDEVNYAGQTIAMVV